MADSGERGLHPWANHSANVRCDDRGCRLCHPHQFTGCGAISPAARCECGLTYGELLASLSGSSGGGADGR